MAQLLYCCTLDRTACMGLHFLLNSVLGQDTLLSVPLSTQVYEWILANLIRGVTHPKFKLQIISLTMFSKFQKEFFNKNYGGRMTITVGLYSVHVCLCESACV